ncbi:hypothetical protein HELRODRAFT_153081, partial [Helobdella robusta]|uniref:AGC-kinase C-terminal domain-containing protein n=1 Tax=Helobdella robusta TaxID=6412 RepID=T1EKZ3_HELRO
FPKVMSNDVKDLVNRVLVIDVSKRLGCMKNGAIDVKKHKWFSNMNWYGLYHKKV